MLEDTTDLISVVSGMLVCAICEQRIKQPKYLPCHHSFCFECIVDTLKLNQQKITCSVCYATHTLTFEQMNTLATDTMKSNLIIPFMNEKLKFQKTKCDVCDDDEEPGVSACVDCEIFLCDLHQKAHFKAKETKTHQIIIHHTNPYVVDNNRDSQISDFRGASKSLSSRPTPVSSPVPLQSLPLIPVGSPLSDISTTPPMHKRKLDDTSSYDEKTPKKRGKRSGVHDQKWDQNFDILKTMRAQTGSFAFIRDDPTLKSWVTYMKHSYKSGKLAPERIEALEQIGFTWKTEKQQIRWDQRLEQLRQYKELHNHCNVPSTARGEYSGLGQWLASTRMKKRNGQLSEIKTQELEEIGVEWSLKRTAKVPSVNSQVANTDDYYDEDDSGSNNNDNDNEFDDEDAEQPSGSDQSTAPPAGGNMYQGQANSRLPPPLQSQHSPGFPPSSSSPSSGSLPGYNSNFHSYNFQQPLNKDRPVLSNPNMTPANQNKERAMLDFLAASIGDVTVKKDKFPPPPY
eukprot:Phypoly_transcript_06019.p1 GENE.Phypoly_transcript_06019~~Phypoly_transcript_06019.p1  ORF type:complete len:513 (+),score=79.88 Phypoly_transcript_06019:139-1677(+)